MSNSDACPCFSNKNYQTCCQPFHQGKLPKTALELMRSRFSAYKLKLYDYIIKTTHPASPNYNNDERSWLKELAQFCKYSEFQNLEILEFKEKGSIAVVVFFASLIQEGHDASFTERAYFEKRGNKWFYRTGEVEGGRDVDLVMDKELRILPLAYYGNPILRKKADPVLEITDEIRTFISDMIETMDACNGLGLAAPQVHKSLRIFVMRKPEEKDDHVVAHEVVVLINPELSEPSPETWSASEGCLSVPTVRDDVTRPKSITVEYLDLEGNKQKRTVSGWEAKVIMHENDHINGVLFMDRLSKPKQEKWKPALQKLKKRMQ